MKRIFNFLKQTPMLIVFILIIVFYMPTALVSPAETSHKSIVVALGIDKLEKEYELSFLTFIPIANQSFVENYKVVSSVGNSIAEAIDIAGLNIGKEVSLSHTTATILNEKMLEDDVTKYIDFLGRTISLSTNTSFICTNKSAKDLLMEIQKLSGGEGINIDEIISKNRDYIYSIDNSLESFYRGYYSNERVALMTYLSLEGENAKDGIDASSDNGSAGGGESSGGGGTSSGGESKQEKKKIVNDGKTLIIKDGKKIGELDKDELKSINLFTGNFEQGIIVLEDVTDKDFKNANLAFKINSKGSKIKTSFENGIPIINVFLKIEASLDEILENEEKKEFNIELTEISQNIKNLIEQKIKSDFSRVLEILREKKADVIGVQRRFRNNNRKKFIEYLKTLDDKDDYLNGIIFRFSVKTTPS